MSTPKINPDKALVKCKLINEESQIDFIKSDGFLNKKINHLFSMDYILYCLNF
ncbi:Uncharacterized protein dnm_060820 [Desulfonema magnum]|uniref:Uncharacterized protein n=1 Tax=Desulfonema magnum TaxID=45655 RepID=A0A975BQV3_9BACT|nr:Uncharacterized protein dnm_060820 [Desulfonema magnum]